MVYSTKLRFNPQVGEDIIRTFSLILPDCITPAKIIIKFMFQFLITVWWTTPGPGKMEDFPAPAKFQWSTPAPAILGLPGPGQNPAPGRPMELNQTGVT